MLPVAGSCDSNGLYVKGFDVNKLILIAAAGGMGALARYGLSGLVYRVLGAGFPWGTLAVNVCGCFLFGLIFALAESRLMLASEVRLMVLVGFMGSFTTMSTFMFETDALFKSGDWLMALGNLAAQNIIGLAAVMAGIALARLW